MRGNFGTVPVSYIPIARPAASKTNVDEDTSSDDMSSASVPFAESDDSLTWTSEDMDDDLIPQNPTVTEKDLKHLPEMVKSGNNGKWPNKADILSYLAEDVIQVIDKPIKMGRREIHSVKELRSYLEL
ncbi:hypothetical protein WA026_002139 [Henosepilachna vigintioctopunctata]|uniref:Uncharacterized protein n=1 Tax=Henosepilachna vigintioctopunctata TaxID=420089 RepID=A0AAW1U0B3_9CUCU